MPEVIVSNRAICVVAKIVCPRQVYPAYIALSPNAIAHVANDAAVIEIDVVQIIGIHDDARPLDS